MVEGDEQMKQVLDNELKSIYIHKVTLNVMYCGWIIQGQGLPGGSDGKESACNAGDLGSIPGLGRSPGEGMATHSSILAWRIPWTEETVWLQSMGLQRVRHNIHNIQSKILKMEGTVANTILLQKNSNERV